MFLLDYKVFIDKLLAGWTGKSLGGVVGAPYENHKQFNAVPDAELFPSILYPNDDLDLQIVWLEALQEGGLDLTSEDLAHFWQDRNFYSCCEYGVFLNNLERGIHPPLSGTWNNDFFIASEGCPIRSEIWGYLCAGNPRLAMDYAARDGVLDHGPVSVAIEQFYAAADALSFTENDLDALLGHAAALMPAGNPAPAVLAYVKEVLSGHANRPEEVWRLLIRRYGSRDASKAVTNLSLVLAALLLGHGDFKATIHFCVQFGWDTDCTAATCGALLGSLFGTACLPKDWCERMGKNLICAVQVRHKTSPLIAIAEETALLAAEMVKSGRNRAIKFRGAPAVAVRPAVQRPFTWELHYQDDTPVLWKERPTSMRLSITSAAGRRGLCLQIVPPENCACDATQFPADFAAGVPQEFAFTVRRIHPEAWLPQRNLFHFQLVDAKGKAVVAEYTAGLGGAHQWQVYGPYWDMWDKDKYLVCPYQNPEKKCNPAMIGINDFFNQHVRLEHHYLDEERLLHEALPQELPFSLEAGTDMLTRKDFGGFSGQCCYYMVMTLKADEPLEGVMPSIGHVWGYKLWVDGKLLDRNAAITGNAPEVYPDVHFPLTGKPQRIVLKFTVPADEFQLSFSMLAPYPAGMKHGVSTTPSQYSELP